MRRSDTVDQLTLRYEEEVHGTEVGQVVPLYLPVDDGPQFPRIPLVDRWTSSPYFGPP